MSTEGSLLKARAGLLLDHPFFGTLSLSLALVQDDDQPTAATDGASIVYNEKFVNKQSGAQLKGLLAHEILHCSGCHHTRRQERDPELWNIACDYVINDIVIASGLILPEGGLVDTEGKYTGMSSEEVYAQLNEMDEDKRPSPCKWGAVLDAGSQTMGAATGSEAEAEWTSLTTQAAEAAKAAGKLPAHIESFLQDLVDSQVDWRTVLWPFFTALNTDDYSWTRPNRAYISEDEYFPSMREETCGSIAIGIDTSGSCAHAIDTFFSELDAICQDVRPARVIVVQVDTRVTRVDVIEQGQRLKDIDIAFKGGGGTRFVPFFEEIADNWPEVEAIAYLTDLESYDIEECERLAIAPVLWVNTEKTEAPFGQTVYFNKYV